MLPTLPRRHFMLVSAALAAQFGFNRLGLAQLLKGADVPIVDGLVIKVLTDSSYDTPLLPQSKWVKVKRAGASAR